MTEKIEILGNPFIDIYKDSDKIYARNIWTLQAYKGEIYIGGGNSSNEGPAKNAGPVPVIKYSPIENKFIKEFTVQEEQIDLYYVYQNYLFIPGHDPSEDWTSGNLYVRSDDGVWIKRRNLTNGLHNYSIINYQNLLFCGIKQNKGSAIAVSKDLGETWKITNINYPRIFSFFILKDKLYIVTEVKVNAKNPIFEYVSETQYFHRRDIFNENLFPGILLNEEYGNKMIKSITYDNKLIYIGAHSHNDHQSKPFGVFVADSFEKNKLSIKKINLKKGEIPWDLKKANDKVYLLTSKKELNKTNISVFVMNENLTELKELFHFYSSTFARSFEILNNDFYFGLGCEIENSKKWNQIELIPETGQILRIKGSALGGI